MVYTVKQILLGIYVCSLFQLDPVQVELKNIKMSSENNKELGESGGYL